ncbi:MAG: hypothetical protein JWP69_1953 [Flaviaesturariibacter sp.]|nr:hypothetical protein [Flaviaesturariibacter sp.]
MGDTWRWHFYSIGELSILKKDPLAFFSDLSNNYEHGYGRFLSSRSSWWNDLHRNAFTKLLTIFNLLSASSYFINTIFYSFLTLFGSVAFFKMMQDAFPRKKAIQVICIFLLPSFLYWCSGIHKDGLTFLGIALVVYPCYFGWRKRRLSIGGVVSILLGLLLLLLYRNYLLVVLFPALLTWMIAERFGKKPLLVFSVAYLFFAFLFFGLPKVFPGIDLPRAVVEKQEDFATLKGSSFVPIKKLEPNFKSFLTTAPYALELTLLRPFPTDAKHLFSLIAVLENLGILVLIGLAVLFRQKQNPPPAFFWFCLFLSLSILLIVGYTVNFLGAIVRYRSIVLPILLTPILCQVNWKRLKYIKNKYV